MKVQINNDQFDFLKLSLISLCMLKAAGRRYKLFPVHGLILLPYFAFSAYCFIGIQVVINNIKHALQVVFLQYRHL